MCRKFLKTRKNLKKHSFKAKTKIKNKFLGTNILAAMLMIVLLGVSFSYVWLINDRAILGYETLKLEKEVNLSKEKNEKIELKLAEAQKINLIKQRAQEMKLSVINDVDYLTVNSSGLAVVK